MAIENLLTLALIKRDRSSRTFSMHRLVQTAFKYSLTLEQKQQAFNDAVVLLYNVFPRRDTNQANLYLKWDRCATYMRHVIRLKDCFREERKESLAFAAMPLYCNLNNSCQR